MPRFAFNVPGDGSMVMDADGVELPCRSAAKSKAVQLLGTLAVADPQTIEAGGVFVLHVLNLDDNSRMVVNLGLKVS